MLPRLPYLSYSNRLRIERLYRELALGVACLSQKGTRRGPRTERFFACFSRKWPENRG